MKNATFTPADGHAPEVAVVPQETPAAAVLSPEPSDVKEDSQDLPKE